MRIERARFADLPNADYLVRLAQRAEWFVLQVPIVVTVTTNNERLDPTEQERARLVRELSARLPEHEVSDGGFLPDPGSLAAARESTVATSLHGLSRFGIRRPVTEQTLEDNLDLLVAATEEYCVLANVLIRRLARQLGAELSDFSIYGSWQKYESRGLLLSEAGEGTTGEVGEWAYFFHGADCAFGNRQTSMPIEVRLGCGPLCGLEFGILDPGFFMHFINVSCIRDRPEYLPLAEALRDWWENARRALKFMEQRGLLRYVASDSVVARGWIITDSSSFPCESVAPTL